MKRRVGECGGGSRASGWQVKAPPILRLWARLFEHNTFFVSVPEMGTAAATYHSLTR